MFCCIISDDMTFACGCVSTARLPAGSWRRLRQQLLVVLTAMQVAQVGRRVIGGWMKSEQHNVLCTVGIDKALQMAARVADRRSIQTQHCVPHLATNINFVRYRLPTNNNVDRLAFMYRIISVHPTEGRPAGPTPLGVFGASVLAPSAFAPRRAFVTRADFLKVGHFAPFSQILHIKGRNIPNVFFSFTSAYETYEPWKVSWKSVPTFLRNPERRHTDRQARTDRRGEYI